MGLRHNVGVGAIRTRYRKQGQSACRSPWCCEAARIASCTAISRLRMQVSRGRMDGRCTVLNGSRRTTHTSVVDRGRTLPQPLQTLVQERRRFADRALSASKDAMIRNNAMSITSRPNAFTQIINRPSSRSSDLSAMWLSMLRWTVAIAKRAYPIALVFALFGAALAATIALRLAIWLPMYLYQGHF